MTALKIILALLTFIGLPFSCGLFALRLSKGHDGYAIWELPALSFVLGLLVWAILAFIGYLMQVSLFLLMGGYVIFIVLLLLFSLLKRHSTSRIALNKFDPFDLTILLTVCLLVVVYYFIGAYQDPSADTFRHLAFIRKLADSGILNKDVFFVSSNVPYNLVNGTYAYEILYPLYAGVSKLFGVDPAIVWFHAPAVLIPILASAYYLLATRLFKNRQVALITLVLFLFFLAFVANGLRALGEPYFIALVGYLVFLASWVRASEQPDWKWGTLLLFSIWGASLLLSHSQWWAYSLMTLAVLVAHHILRWEIRSGARVLVLMGGIGLFSLPVFAFKGEFYGAISQNLGSVLGDRYEATVYKIRDLFAFNPLKTFDISMWIFLVIAIGVIIVALRRNYHQADFGGSFAALSIALITFVMLNPLLVPLISKLATINTVSRMESLAKVWGIFMGAYVIYSSRGWIRDRWQSLSSPVRRWISIGIGVGGLGVLVFQPLLRFLYGVQSPVVRQQIQLILTKRFGISEALLRSVASHLGIVLLVGSLLVGMVLVFLFWKGRRIFGTFLKSAWIRTPRTLQIGAPLALVCFLLVLPGSQLSPWKIVISDQFYSKLYGPTVSQVVSQKAFLQMFATIPKGSVVLTDATNLVLAFHDVKIVGDVHGIDPQAQEANQFIAPLFEFETPKADVIQRLVNVKPDYLLLSPRYSHLAWMKYDNYPDLFQKVYDQVIPGIEYFNNRFVIYKLDLSKAQAILDQEANTVTSQRNTNQGENCDAARIIPGERYEIPPQGWDRTGDELHDGDWNTTDGSLMWLPLKETWFYIEFDLKGAFNLDRVEVKNNHFTSSYHLEGLALFGSDDDTHFSEIKTIPITESLGVGEHHWSFDHLDQSSQYLRLAIQSEGLTTLGEVEIYGCPVVK
jgi:hypothetical protein